MIKKSNQIQAVFIDRDGTIGEASKDFSEVNYMKMRAKYTCPLELTHDITKGKWKPIILWQLRLGKTSLVSLEKNIQGINQKMLIEQLKELLDFGMIAKKTFAGYPLKVEYFLTERGEKMLEAITIMQHIGVELMQENGMEDVLKAKGFIS
jgi:DNA-binding HxlR family transcriptional regulator